MRRFLLSLLFLPVIAFAGQSLVLAPGVVATSPEANTPNSQSWRIEFQIHDWVLPPQGVYSAYVFYLSGAGVAAAIYPDGTMGLIDWRDTGFNSAPCRLPLSGRQNVLVRFQRDVPNKALTCEIWNSDGTGYQQANDTIISVNSWTQNGVTLGSANTNTNLGFLHLFSTIVPNGGRPPVTADSGDLLNLTFDAGPSASSISMSSGSYVATPTPGQNPVALAKTAGAPYWNNWVSLRAGFPAQLDGSQSFSLADGSSQVTYQWQQLTGPTTVRWSDTTSGTPTIEGLIFGTYTFQLTVKDVAGSTNSATFQVGAVATDANGVVVQADPNADKLFGPMIAFGQNPWGYADERALRATTLRSAAYDAQGLTTPTWTVPLSGTVTYNLEPTPTTTVTAISATDMSIQVNDLSNFDLSTFPTRVLLGNAPFEEVRICSVAGNTLQVCYDGRGFRSGSSYHYTAIAWSAGTRVFQNKVKGAGTQFLKDFCQAGAGWSGLISYQDGTVAVTPGSSSLTGNGTSWSNTNAGGRAIRIQGTHNGGAPFVFQSYVSAVNGATSLTLSRPWPSDADPGTFDYSLINADTRNITPHYVRGDGSDGIIYFLTSGCESDTDLYLYFWWDGITGVQVDKQYAYMDGLGYVGDFGPNFYDEVLAHYALYYRSGWTPARDAARKLGDNWLDYPELANGDAGFLPRRMSVTGVTVGAVLDGRTKNWSGLRTLANTGVRYASTDCDDDVRENAYALSWLALAALFDPNDTGSSTEPNQRSYWKSQLFKASQRDASCAGADHSWKSGIYWNAGAYPPLTVTNGSPIATGSNLPASLCPAVASGTGFATPNSAVITGSGFQAGTKILITGTLLGQPYTGGFEFRLDNPNQISLAVLWPGDAGPITWMIDGSVSNGTYATIALDNVKDSRFGQIWTCHWDSSSQLTLNRPWVGQGTETLSIWRDTLVGRGTQPFMLGIKTLQMYYGSLVDDPATASSYRDLAGQAANWILTQGYDPLLKAVVYGRIFPQCEPPVAESGISTLDTRLPQCVENSANYWGPPVARVRNSEVQNAVRVGYETNHTNEVKALGDQMYCAQWGKATMTQPGYCTEPMQATNLDDVSLGSYKWTGFFFGIGMAHQWPAARVGGVSPAVPQTVSVNLDLSQAASARVTVTQPSSATQQFLCSSSPCQVQVDARQGAHWVQIDYLSSTGQVLSSTPPDLISGTGLTVVSTGPVTTPAVTPVTVSPSFNVAAGTLPSPKSVSITSTTSGASIRYTTDGTIPTSTVGTVYSGPVTVSSTLTLKAIAYASAMTDSSVTTATYTIAAPVTGTGTGSGNVSVTGGATAWYNGSWTNRKAITIDHTKVSGTGSLTDFPLLFSVTDANLRAVANGGNVGKPDGTDILFTASDGVTKLDHELESYSASAGQVNAWVRLPALSPAADTVIYVYYGNSAAADQQKKTTVWDSNYKLVWHLADGTTLRGADSTSYGNNGIVYGPAAAGEIGGAAGGVVEGTSVTVPSGDHTRTAECWFKFTGDMRSDQVICGMGYDSGTGTIFSLMYRAAGSTLSLDAKGIARSFSWTPDTNWHHIAATYAGGSGLQNAVVYLDGAPQNTTGGTGALATQYATYFDVQHSPAYPWSDMAGVVDEFRISDIARPAAWNSTEYKNQSLPSAFFSVGGQEPGSSSTVSKVATPTIAPPGGSYNSAQLVTISTATTGASIRYTTDGSTPSSTTGTAYTGPISVKSSLTLKAIAYASGMTDSSVITATYTITSGSVTTTPAVGNAPWYNRLWANRKAIIIDHSKVSGNLVNFPMLFSVTDANLKTVAIGGRVGRSDGADVLFTDADGVTKLDHQLDGYSSSTGQLSAWVRLPAVSSTTDTVIYVYYGNPTAADQQNRTGVWDGNYKLVWHLGDGTAVNPTDSTGNRSDGVVYGAKAAPGVAGGGAAGVLEGVLNGLINAGDATRTLECWFKITRNFGSDQVICGMGYQTTGNLFSLMYRAVGSKLSLDSDGIARSVSWTPDSNWHHLVAAYTGGTGLQNTALYLDGVLQTTTGGSGPAANMWSTYYDVQHSPAYPLNDMTGVVDEFRVSNVARTGAWIATEYSNQNSPTTFFSVAAQQ